MQMPGRRSLEAFAQGLGREFRRRALPSTPWYAVLAALGLLVAASGDPWRLLFAMAALLLSARMVGWMARAQRRWAVWQVAAVLMLVVFQPRWSGLGGVVEDRLMAVFVLLAMFQVAWNSLRVWQFSRKVQRAADAMGDARILEVLPPEAAAKAREWQGGDDSNAFELGQVVSLAVLYEAMQQARLSQRMPGVAHACKGARR